MLIPYERVPVKVMYVLWIAEVGFHPKAKYFTTG
tara:strand:- start:6234 stop:6335 length:102 start_codon:yes stop_codon:yes gene_type:complete